MEPFNFDPEQGFLDTSVYTDPTTGTEARTQLMSLHSQEKTFINQIVTQINLMAQQIVAITGATGDAAAIAQIESDLAAVKVWYFTDTITAPGDGAAVYTDGYKNTYDNALITAATEILVQFPNRDYAGLVAWETRSPGVGETDGHVDLYFSSNPTGLSIRVIMLTGFATAV